MRSTKLFPALAFLAAAACADPSSPRTDTTTPIDTVPKVASIAYATDAALVFVKHVAAVRDLVKAYDSTGAELSSSVLDLQLPAGWTRAGDSVHAPTAETFGIFRATAKAANSLRAELANAAEMDSTALTAGLDLRTYNWTAAWTCSQPDSVSVIKWGDGTPVDTARYSVAIDSTGYAGSDSSFIRNYGGVATMYWHGTGTFVLRDGRTETAAVGDPIPILRQAVDTLVFDPSYTGSDDLTATKAGGSTTYSGASWCSQDWRFGTRGPVTLAGTPKP
jgi:hypothetical protein